MSVASYPDCSTPQNLYLPYQTFSNCQPEIECVVNRLFIFSTYYGRYDGHRYGFDGHAVTPPFTDYSSHPHDALLKATTQIWNRKSASEEFHPSISPRLRLSFSHSPNYPSERNRCLSISHLQKRHPALLVSIWDCSPSVLVCKTHQGILESGILFPFLCSILRQTRAYRENEIGDHDGLSPPLQTQVWSRRHRQLNGASVL